MPLNAPQCAYVSLIKYSLTRRRRKLQSVVESSPNVYS